MREALQRLNELVELDSGTFRRLLDKRTWCGRVLANRSNVHTETTTYRIADVDLHIPTVSFLDILNAILDSPIEPVWEGEKLVRFQKR